MEDSLKWMLKMGITEKVQSSNGQVSCVGFNPEEQKWYGWSHRAVYGFGIGSTVHSGDCGYRAVDKQDYLQYMEKFWKDDHNDHVVGVHEINEGVEGVRVHWEYNGLVPNTELRGTISSVFNEYPEEFGKGEWEAKTLEDAYYMACDFAEGVS